MIPIDRSNECGLCGTELDEELRLRCPFCEAHPELVNKINSNPYYLGSEIGRYKKLSKKLDKKRRGYIIWMILALLWVWLIAQSDVAVSERIPEAIAGVYGFVMLYAIPLAIGFTLFFIGYKRSKKKKEVIRGKLRAIDPALQKIIYHQLMLKDEEEEFLKEISREATKEAEYEEAKQKQFEENLFYDN